MDVIIIFAKSLLLGFVTSAPVGPAGVLVLKNSFKKSSFGIKTGFGAALADSCFALAALWGFSSVSRLMDDYYYLISAIGISVLLFLGLLYWKYDISKLQNDFDRGEEKLKKKSARLAFLQDDLKALASAFAVTISNPVPMAGFAFLFAFLGPEESMRSSSTRAMVVGGVFIGAQFWWCCLSYLGHRFGRKLSKDALLKFYRIMGMLLIILAFVYIGRVLLKIYTQF